MLIEFSVENFRSFKERQTFSMVAGPASKNVAGNSFQPRLKGFGRFTRSAAIYGANAAGKTNLLRALQFMQQMVINSASTATGVVYAHTPFIFDSAARQKPSHFSITFAQNNVWYEYAFSIGPERIIEEEWLVEHLNARGRVLFERRYSKKKGDYDWKYSPSFKGQRALWSEATRPTALFLSTAIQLNSKHLLPVYEWFQKRLVVIVGVTALNPTLTLALAEHPDGKASLLPFLQEADLGISDVIIRREPLPPNVGFIPGPQQFIERVAGSDKVNLVLVTLTHKIASQNDQIGLDLAEESSGTQVLFRTAGAWLNVLKNGEVLLFDEIDTSLHPLLVHYLIQRFHSDAVNPLNAQLIFTTHNTSLLNQQIFARDQIWFVEKDREASSKLYPLTDFSPRNDEDLQRGYMRGRYGALPILGVG